MNRIAIDLDEVLVPFLQPLANYHGRTLPKRQHPYLFREVFDCSEEESRAMVYEYYRSPEFLFTRPIDASQPAMQKIRRQFHKMYVVTGRQDAARTQTERWIDMYFPGVFDDVILTNSFTPYEVGKLDICRALSIGYLIDDNMDLCEAAGDAGVCAKPFIGENTYNWCYESDEAIRGWRNYIYASKTK